MATHAPQSSSAKPRLPPPELPPLFSTQLLTPLHALLTDLQQHPYATRPSPAAVPRRASVAVIIRIRPHHSHPAPAEDRTSPLGPFPHTLATFFAQPWVQHGDPELLFIKRATNPRDPWTGHIALPGGRHDAGQDADDAATAVRETREEVGVDLVRDAVAAGNLDQVVVKAGWGSTPVMTLCPYVFVVVRPVVLRLQPSEVFAAHWVPLRVLLDRGRRDYWVQDVAARTGRVQLLTGNMLFAAVRLLPSESVWATETEEFRKVGGKLESEVEMDLSVPLIAARRKLEFFQNREKGLQLWGLTLGVVGDFLDMLPPYDVIGQFVFPTFTHPDVRFFLWLLSRGLRKQHQIASGDSILNSKNLPSPDTESCLIQWPNQEGIPELRYYGRIRSEVKGRRAQTTMSLLPAYYHIIRKAVATATTVKIGLIGIILSFLYRKYRSSS